MRPPRPCPAGVGSCRSTARPRARSCPGWSARAAPPAPPSWGRAAPGYAPAAQCCRPAAMAGDRRCHLYPDPPSRPRAGSGACALPDTHSAGAPGARRPRAPRQNRPKADGAANGGLPKRMYSYLTTSLHEDGCTPAACARCRELPPHASGPGHVQKKAARRLPWHNRCAGRQAPRGALSARPARVRRRRISVPSRPAARP